MASHGGCMAGRQSVGSIGIGRGDTGCATGALHVGPLLISVAKGPGMGMVSGKTAARHRVMDRSLIRTAQAANGPAKRAVDILGSLAALIFLAPALLPAALLAGIAAGAAPLTAREVIGRQGRRFTCLRLPTRQAKTGRRTRLAPLLEATGLAAAPMLMNVLAGQMSLVGPSPLSKAELELYGRDRRFYLLVRPGMTSLSHSDPTMKDRPAVRAALDRLYVQTWSMWLDLGILARAPLATLRNIKPR